MTTAKTVKQEFRAILRIVKQMKENRGGQAPTPELVALLLEEERLLKDAIKILKR